MSEPRHIRWRSIQKKARDADVNCSGGHERREAMQWW